MSGPFKYTCDGKYDCPNGDDEQKCANRICEGLFRCQNSTRCLHYHDVGDGQIDCKEGDDEFFNDLSPCPIDCLNPVLNGLIPCYIPAGKNMISSSTIGGNLFVCNDGSIISSHFLCDGVPHCLNIEDELNCTCASYYQPGILCKEACDEKNSCKCSHRAGWDINKYFIIAIRTVCRSIFKIIIVQTFSRRFTFELALTGTIIAVLFIIPIWAIMFPVTCVPDWYAVGGWALEMMRTSGSRTVS